MDKLDIGTWWRRLEGNAMYFYFRLVDKTARFTTEGMENLAAARAMNRPILWACWHGQGLSFLHWGNYHLDAKTFTAVVVGDKRFDILERLITRLGAKSHAVDMQGNPVAAGRGVLKVIQDMKAGMQSLIFPDGPDGPAYEPKKGVTFLARKAKGLILPIGVWTKNAYFMKRWDSYAIPFPFARFHASIGEPICVDKDTNEGWLREGITASLDARRTRAQIMAGIKP